MAAFYDLGVVAAGGHDPELIAHDSPREHLVLYGRWKELIPREQWSVFVRVIKNARRRNLHFAFGGAFAVATYTGKWRDTKDMDLYILPTDREKMIDVLTESGLSDYFPVKDYDRSWIYRAHQGDVIVDTIWSMANHRTDVDVNWLTRGPLVEFGQDQVRVIPAEELIWSKLYVLQKDRCDWPDIMNLIHATGPALDWKRLRNRLEDDQPLLEAVLRVFQWLAPERAAELPAWLWNKRARIQHGGCEHVRLLDRRPWFHPLEDSGEKGAPKQC